MTWKTIYEHYDEWEEDVVKELILEMTDLHKATAEEIVDFAYYFTDDKTTGMVARQAVNAGVAFTAEQVLELGDSLEPEDFTYVLLRAMLSGVVFTPEQVCNLDGYLDEKAHTMVVLSTLKHGYHFSAEQILRIDGLVTREAITAMTLDAIEQGIPFTAEQINNMDGLVSQDILNKAALANMASFSEADAIMLQDVVDPRIVNKIIRSASAKSGRGSFSQPPQPSEPSTAALYTLLSESLRSNKKQKEPEFHVGDAVVVRGGFGAFGRIIDVQNGMYVVRHTDGKYVSSFTADEIAHVEM